MANQDAYILTLIMQPPAARDVLCLPVRGASQCEQPRSKMRCMQAVS